VPGVHVSFQYARFLSAGVYKVDITYPGGSPTYYDFGTGSGEAMNDYYDCDCVYTSGAIYAASTEMLSSFYNGGQFHIAAK
jgi:hypothetical protein